MVTNAAYRAAIESLYTGVCSIYEYVHEKDPTTKRKGAGQEKLVHEDIKCRLSYNGSNIVVQAEGGKKEQIIKIFMSPEIEVKANSKIVVTQNNRQVAFINSSQPKVYESHQEIELRLFEKWA